MQHRLLVHAQPRGLDCPPIRFHPVAIVATGRIAHVVVAAMSAGVKAPATTCFGSARTSRCARRCARLGARRCRRAEQTVEMGVGHRVAQPSDLRRCNGGQL